MINTTRHNEVFNSSLYQDKKIVIVGAGSIGSRVFENLASTGLTNITIIDFDKVESHNLANQLFSLEDIGEYKVDALKKWCVKKCGEDTAEKVIFSKAKIEAGMHSYVKADIIISCVDNFATRALLLDQAMDSYTPMFIDTRMASNNVYLFMVDMDTSSKVEQYHKTIGDDDDPKYETSACGSSLTVGATAQLIGAMCCWSVMVYLRDSYIEESVRLIASPFELMHGYAS